MFWHRSDHQEIVDAVKKQLGLTLATYVIDPMPLKDLRSWLRRHQSYHSDMNGLFQIQGSDLQGLDLKNPEVMRQWMWSHWQEHQSVRAVLGI